MRLYLDTADRTAAENLLATALFTGVATNPTIPQRAELGGSAIPDIYRWATRAGSKEVFSQAWGEDPATLVRRGRELRSRGTEVVVKLAASRAGTQACAELAAEAVRSLERAARSAGTTDQDNAAVVATRSRATLVITVTPS
ncbi:transaldolase family protein [Actinoplanes sp. NPDC051470]|uniref:transaldolase family protein n=1 Tax=unclassified Actinoplanes TaxID=2626549 RepID=UPI003416543B